MLGYVTKGLQVKLVQAARTLDPAAAGTGPPSDRERRPFYHPELDVLRFCAFLLVYVAHSAVMTRNFPTFSPGVPTILASAFIGAGFSGLALFFTLSSYLITALLLQEQEGTGGIHFRAFYMRRLLRIWPLYFFFLLIVRPLAAHYIADEHFSLGQYLAFSLLMGNWICYYQGFPISIAAPLWSISVEEQFYLFWPLLVSRLRRHVPTLALGMLVVANLSRVILVLYPRPDPALWCSTFTRLDPFAGGALLAFYTHNREVRIGRLLRVLLITVAAFLILFLGRSGAHNGDMALLFYPLESVTCCLALLAALLPMGSWKPGIVGRVLVYLGRVSYGLYVYHLMILALVNRFTSLNFLEHESVVLVGTVATAAASYAGLERPVLKLKQRFTYVRSR